MFLYKINTPDLEQFKSQSLQNFVHRVNEGLINLDSDNNFRIVHFNGESFIQTKELISDFPLELEEVSREKYSQLIFGQNDIFSDEWDGENCFLANNRIFKFIRILEMKDTDLNFLGQFSNFVLNFKKVENSIASAKADSKRSVNLSSLNNQKRDIKAERAYLSNEEVIGKIEDGKESIFHVDISIVACSDTHQKVNFEFDFLIKECRKRGIRFLVETVGIPYCVDNLLLSDDFSLVNSFPVNSLFLVNLLPLHKDQLHKSGVPLQSVSGSDIYYDMFNKGNINFNAIFVGPTGSGKSFLAGALCEHEFRTNGTKIVIIEKGSSYKKLNKRVGGVDLFNKFNPMLFKNVTFLRGFILSFYPDDVATKKISGRLLLELKKIDLNKVGNFSSLLENLDESFSDLKYYTADSLNYIQDDILDLDDFAYADLESIPKTVLRPFILFVIEYVESLSGRRILFLDEVHYLFKNNPDFVEEKYREARKKGWGVWSATHDLTEFLDSPIGKVIFTCSYTKIVFNHSVESRMEIDQEKIQKINSTETIVGSHSEFLLWNERNSKVCQYRSTPFQYEILTTNDLEVAQQEEFFRDREPIFGFNETMEKFVEAKYAVCI